MSTVGVVVTPAVGPEQFTVNGDGTKSQNIVMSGSGQQTSANSAGVVLTGDLEPSKQASVDLTLGVVDQIYSWAVPSWAKGCQIFNASARLRYNLNNNTLPNSYATSSASDTADLNYLGNYNSVFPNGIPVSRLFTDPVRPTQINFNTETAGATFTLEFF